MTEALPFFSKEQKIMKKFILKNQKSYEKFIQNYSLPDLRNHVFPNTK